MAQRNSKPLYVTTIDDAKFDRIQEIAAKPLIWAFVFVSTGIFGLVAIVIAGIALRLF